MDTDAQTDSHTRLVVKEAVMETLLAIGVDTSNPIAMQADFRFIREFREGATAFKRKGMGAVAVTLVSGLLAVLWLGIRHSIAR